MRPRRQRLAQSCRSSSPQPHPPRSTTPPPLASQPAWPARPPTWTKYRLDRGQPATGQRCRSCQRAHRSRERQRRPIELACGACELTSMRGRVGSDPQLEGGRSV
eukprot:7075200-Prymnesium_polylepis.2